MVRCIALADELKLHGNTSVLAFGGEESLRMAELRGIPCIRVAPGASDPEATIELAASHSATVLITDLANRSVTVEELARYHVAVRGRIRSAAFTSGVMTVGADIVISPYVGAVAPSGSSLSRYLMGPEYFVVRRPIRDVMMTVRQIESRARRVVVAIGGADPSLLTTVALFAALRAGVSEVRAVLGPAAQDEVRSSVRRVASADARVLVTGDDGLIDALLWADIAITGDGLLKYECAAVGLPTVVARSSLTDSSLAERFETAGTAWRTKSSPASQDEITELVARLAADPGERARMSRLGRELIDGSGGRRVLGALGLT